MRLRTLPLAASSVLAASAFGWNHSRHTIPIFVFALLTTFLLQVLSNFANDFGDYESGVDNQHRVGPARALQSGKITRDEMKRAMIICSILTLASGLTLLYYAFYDEGLFVPALIFLIVGMCAIAAAIKYTVGKNPYGYSGLGDIAVFVFSV